MRLTPWLAAAAVVTASSLMTGAQAGLFDRLRDRADAREKREAELKASAAESLKPSGGIGFHVDSEHEIGKLITPVSYQPLPAPGATDGALRPIPEPYLPPAPDSGSLDDSRETLSAGQPYPLPPASIPAYPMEAYPPGVPAYPVSLGNEGYPLYPRVEYEDLDHVHPCGVPTVVQVLDPCENPCASCGPRCVYVQICVPPNQRPRIKVEDHGRKVKYKFDDYQVEIESEDGVVSVDYDD